MCYPLSSLAGAVALLLAACTQPFIAADTTDDAAALTRNIDAAIDSEGAIDAPPVVDASIPDAKSDLLPPYQAHPATIGPAKVVGTYKGTPIAISHAWALRIDVLDANLDALIFMPQGGSCASAAQAMPTRLMYFQICSDGTPVQNTGDLCELDGVSYYTDAKLSLPGADPVSGNGTITLGAFDTTTGGTVHGSFKIEFDGEMLEGSFNTVGCGPFGEDV